MKWCRLHPRHFLSVLPIALACAATPLAAQDTGKDPLPAELDPPSNRVSIGLFVGATITSPDGSFPSLLFVSSADSTGTAPSENGTTGIASRWGITLAIPIYGQFSGIVEGGGRIWSIRYAQGETSRAVRMDFQTSYVALLGRLVLFEPDRIREGETSFSAGIEGGIEFGFGPYRNRIETTIPADTGGLVLAPVDGSFQGGDPFCGQTGLTGSVFGGILFSRNLYIRLEAGYISSFFPLFSEDAIVENDAHISQFTIDIGLNYLF
jgi:hypothetical protein